MKVERFYWVGLSRVNITTTNIFSRLRDPVGGSYVGSLGLKTGSDFFTEFTFDVQTKLAMNSTKSKDPL